MISEYEKSLIGKTYTFADGISLKIVDIKQREIEPWITYEHVYSHALPKRFSQKLGEFMGTYGHLFPKD